MHTVSQFSITFWIRLHNLDQLLTVKNKILAVIVWFHQCRIQLSEKNIEILLSKEFGEGKDKAKLFKLNLFSVLWGSNLSSCLLVNWNLKEQVSFSSGVYFILVSVFILSDTIWEKSFLVLSTGEPGRLIRERYRTASQVVQNQVSYSLNS